MPPINPGVVFQRELPVPLITVKNPAKCLGRHGEIHTFRPQRRRRSLSVDAVEPGLACQQALGRLAPLPGVAPPGKPRADRTPGTDCPRVETRCQPARFGSRSAHPYDHCS